MSAPKKATCRTLLKLKLRYSYKILFETPLCSLSIVQAYNGIQRVACKSNPTVSHPCCRTPSSCSSRRSEHTALHLCCSQTDRDKCNCGLRFGWAFKRKHSLSTSLPVCQRGPLVIQSVCACRSCLSAAVCGESGSRETKTGHMDTNTHKSQTAIGLERTWYGENATLGAHCCNKRE